jgi:hypothetical protein
MCISLEDSVCGFIIFIFVDNMSKISEVKKDVKNMEREAKFIEETMQHEAAFREEQQRHEIEFREGLKQHEREEEKRLHELANVLRTGISPPSPVLKRLLSSD